MLLPFLALAPSVPEMSSVRTREVVGHVARTEMQCVVSLPRSVIRSASDALPVQLQEMAASSAHRSQAISLVMAALAQDGVLHEANNA